MKKQAFNPFLPSYEYVPDGEPRVFDGRVYIYGSHDRFNGQKFCMNDYVTYSAPIDDLGDWRYEGVIFKKTDDPNNADGRLELWAPDCVQGPDGRYYLYYCLANYPGIGVAVCDAPCGTFRFLDYVKDKNGGVLGFRPGDTLTFDPAVLVDCGRVWLYSGNGPLKPDHDPERKKASVVCELESDMITLKSEPTALIPTYHGGGGTSFDGHEFFEASSIRKYGELYYFVYSSVKLHELCYAVSDRPDGGFVYKGVRVSNGDIDPEDRVETDMAMDAHKKIYNYFGNNHGGLAFINGAYYIFYHRQTHRYMYSRQACAEKIVMRGADFFRAEMTSCGLNGGPLVGKGVYEARTACRLYSADGALCSSGHGKQDENHPAFTQSGEDREDAPDQFIANMTDGSCAEFKYFDIQGVTGVKLTTRGDGGVMIIKTGDGVCAEVALPKSVEWGEAYADACFKDGVCGLIFTYKGAGHIDFAAFELI